VAWTSRTENRAHACLAIRNAALLYVPLLFAHLALTPCGAGCGMRPPGNMPVPRGAFRGAIPAACCVLLAFKNALCPMTANKGLRLHHHRNAAGLATSLHTFSLFCMFCHLGGAVLWEGRPARNGAKLQQRFFAGQLPAAPFMHLRAAGYLLRLLQGILPVLLPRQEEPELLSLASLRLGNMAACIFFSGGGWRRSPHSLSRWARGMRMEETGRDGSSSFCLPHPAAGLASGCSMLQAKHVFWA